MKSFLLSLTLALAGILCLGSVAQASSTVWITGEILFPEKCQRLNDIRNRLRNAESNVARARNMMEHSQNAGDRARAAEYVAQYQRLQAEAAELQRFLNAVPHTVLAERDDILNQQQWDDFVRMLRNNPNRRGRTYIYDSRTNRSGVPIDPSTASQRSSGVRPTPPPTPAPVHTGGGSSRPLRPGTNRDSLSGVLGTGN